MSKIKEPIHPASLIDGEERHAEAPATFEIPPAILRHNAKLGDYVKIGFESPNQNGERFWVEITKRSVGGHYVGRVDNELDEDWGVALDDLVAFEPRHILSTW